MCLAVLLRAWRPFVSMMWAPLNRPESQGSAPPGCLWRPAVDIPLRWLSAFLNGTQVALVRDFDLATHLHMGIMFDISFDAPP